VIPAVDGDGPAVEIDRRHRRTNAPISYGAECPAPEAHVTGIETADATWYSNG
jgi:hypothetical protein